MIQTLTTALRVPFKQFRQEFKNGSGWINELIDGGYINSSIDSPLVGSSYTQFPEELKHSIKGLINIQNK